MAKFVQKIADSFANAIANIGNSADPNAATYFQSSPLLTQQNLTSLFAHDWLTRKIVNEYPAQALRPGFQIDDLDEEKSDDLKRQFVKLDRDFANPQGHLFRALGYGRLYGGGALILGTRGSGPNARAPLSEGADLVWLDSVHRWQLDIREREKDANLPNFGQPSVYRITGNHPRNGLELHASRVILTEGLEPGDRDSLQGSDLQNLWWLSVMQPCYEAVQRFGISWQAVGALLLEASVAKFKMAGLYDSIAENDEQTIRKRMLLTQQGKSVARAVFLDAGSNEDFSRDSVSFNSVPDLMTQISLVVSGACGIPVALLFGQAPAGLNATGESDIRQFYDRVSEYREASIRPKLERVFQILAKDPTLTLTFPPLWQMSDLEKSQIRSANASADQIYYNMGLDGEEIILSRSKDESLGLEVDTEYLEKSLEESRNAKEAAPDPNQEGTPGAEPNGRAPSDQGVPDDASRGARRDPKESNGVDGSNDAG